VKGPGRVVIHRLKSKVLEGNPLGDPVDRNLYVYVPAGYDGGDDACPALLAVVGFGLLWIAAESLGEGSLDPIWRAASPDRSAATTYRESAAPPSYPTGSLARAQHPG